MRAELSASTRSVSAAGDRVEYRVAVPLSDIDPGAFYALTALKVTLDLTTIADDVADLDAVFDELEVTQLPGLTVRRAGTLVTFEAPITAGVPEFVASFTLDYASGGDGDLGLTTNIAMRADKDRWDYGTALTLALPVHAAQPAPIISKEVDRTTVTPSDNAVTYTIDVTRPAGTDHTSFVLVDDLTDVLAEARGATPTNMHIVRGSLASPLELANGILQTPAANYDADGRFTLTYSTVHLGGADGVLTNQACAVSETRVYPFPSAETEFAVEGQRACADADPVTIVQDPRDEQENEDDQGGTPAAQDEPVESTPNATAPAPTTAARHPSELAATGGDGTPLLLALSGGLIAAGAGTAALVSAARRRVR